MKKILAVLLCLATLISVASCFSIPNGDTGESRLTYDEILARYGTLLRAAVEQAAGSADTEAVSCAESEEQKASVSSAENIETVLCEIVRNCADPSAMGYATKDLNGDGVEELVLLSKSNKLYALFTQQDGKAVLLSKMDDVTAAIAADGTVYASKYVAQEYSRVTVQTIVQGKLTGSEFGSVLDGETVSYYKVENGTRTEIGRAEYSAFEESVRGILMSPALYTKKTGFRFVSALGNGSAGEDIPVADFSSYDAILTAYERMVEHFPRYTQMGWINGEFDSLFRISDNATYDIFHWLFFQGVAQMPTKEYFGQAYVDNATQAYGYAKKDLNGDGTEELILLRDNYEIIALFTEKDGKAVLLKEASGSWIDGEGQIRCERFLGGVVSRDGERYLYEVKDGALKPVFGVGFRVNAFLQKEDWYKLENGSKVEITDEEGEALYARYEILPHGYVSYAEYTKTHAGITFVPLFGRVTASEAHVKTFTHAYAMAGHSFTVSSITENSVQFSMKYVYTEEPFDPETNPDPEVLTKTLAGEATRDGDIYLFEIDGVKGYVEFAVNSAWVTVTESCSEEVLCKAYLFNYPED